MSRLIITRELAKLEDKGVIERSVQEAGQVVSNVFLRPKANGEFRLILDLTNLNKCVEYNPFKMEFLLTALEILRPRCFMGSVDLKDAYILVPVAEHHRKFIWEGVLYRFIGFPNGLASAPRTFTKL